MFDDAITLGNVITWIVLVVGVAISFERIRSGQLANSRAIDQLRTDREKSTVEVYATIRANQDRAELELRREIADIENKIVDIRAQHEKAQDTVHERITKHIDTLNDSVSGLAIEFRGMHAENTAFRIRVAEEFVSIKSFAETMERTNGHFSKLIDVMMRDRERKSDDRT